MISKKKLDDRIWRNYNQISWQGDSLGELRKQLASCKHANQVLWERIICLEYSSGYSSELQQRVRQLQERMNNLGENCSNSVTAISGRLNALDCAAKVEIDALKKQVQCGIVGHKFELMVVTIDDIDADRSKCFNGHFKCTNCGVEVTFILDEQEIESARTLGMIQ